MKTSMDYLKELEHDNVLKERELTFPEYAAQLDVFQSTVCKAISGKEYYDGMRANEALHIMESEARKKELQWDPAVREGILAMRKLDREMAVTMSGIQGEQMVSKTLSYLTRPNVRIFHNVYLSDGKDETELDTVILMDSEILILEIKQVKSDLTFTEDGRLLRNNEVSYDIIPLGKKMEIKRRLLKKCLLDALAEKGLKIPVFIDSFIVFTTPKDLRIHIEDRYRKEKYCFRSCLNEIINNYLGCAYYKEEHLAQLSEILSAFETNAKRFETSLDFDEIRQKLADALAVLQPSMEVTAKKTADLSACKNDVAELLGKSAKIMAKEKVVISSGAKYIVAGIANMMLRSANVMLNFCGKTNG